MKQLQFEEEMFIPDPVLIYLLMQIKMKKRKSKKHFLS
jgi:hypothetical protein